MKRKTILAVLLTLVLLISMAGYAEPYTERDPVPEAFDTNAGMDVAVDSGANAESDAVSEDVRNSGADDVGQFETDAGNAGVTGTGAGAEATAQPNAGAGAGNAGEPGTGAGTQTGASSGADDVGVFESGAGAGALSGADAGAGASVQPAVGDQLIRKPLYYIVVDCGYAFYGSEKGFENSLAEYPGDPKGEVLNVLESCLSDLVQEDACIVVRGYHSELLGVGEPVSVLNKDAYAAQFKALREGDRTKYYSSKLDVALGSWSEEIAGYAAQYDCTLVLLTGGCVNYYGKKTPDLEGLKGTIDDLRNKGVRIRAFGLAGEEIVDNLSAAFADGEYTPIAVNAVGEEQPSAEGSGLQLSESATEQAPTDVSADPSAGDEEETHHSMPDEAADAVDMDAAYAQARTRMSVELAKMLADCAGQPYEWKEFASQKKALAYLGEQDENNAVLAFYWSDKDGSMCLRQKNSEMQDTVSQYHVYDKYKYISFMVLTDTTEASSDEKKEEEQLRDDFGIFYTTLSTQLVEPLDCADGEVSMPLPQSYDSKKVSFAVADPDLLGADVREGSLVLTPKAVGTTELTLTVQGADPAVLNVSLVDYRLNWGFADGANLSSGELSVSAYDCGDLYWTLRDSSGYAITGNSREVAQAQGNGMGFRLDKDGAMWTLSFSAQEIGQYSIDVGIYRDGERDGEPITTETRRFLVQREITASVNEVSLIWPYFRQQDGQLVQISYKDAGATPVVLSDYQITVEPAGVVEAYTSIDGSALYIVPVGKGTASVTVAEQGVETPNAASVTVTVRALTSNVLLWVCGVGAVLCLILLTAAIVIMIGKRSRKG